MSLLVYIGTSGIHGRMCRRQKQNGEATEKKIRGGCWPSCKIVPIYICHIIIRIYIIKAIVIIIIIFLSASGRKNTRKRKRKKIRTVPILYTSYIYIYNIIYVCSNNNNNSCYV